MGFKLFMVGAAGTPGCLGAPGENDRAAAAVLVRQLTTLDYVYMGEVPLRDTLYPSGDDLFVGAYRDGVLVGHAWLAMAFVDHRAVRPPRGVRPDCKQTLFGLVPQGELLAMVLHSVVNLWGFASHRGGRLCRAAGGAADDGVFLDVGACLPEERPLLATTTLAGLDEEGDGESLVFAASARLFGCGIDALPEPGPMLSHYRRPPRRPVVLLKKLLGR